MKPSRLTFYYCLFISLILFFGGLFTASSLQLKLTQLLLLPLIIYFFLNLRSSSSHRLSQFLSYYSLIFTSLFSLTGLFTASSLPQLISSLFILPLTFHFWFKLLPRRRHALEPIVITPSPPLAPTARLDPDRRRFLKLVGSAGLSVFILSLFSNKAQAAFFGSVPGPGTVSLKDTSGTQIDPAQNQPTDGYMITQLEADSLPAYYGYVEKDGAWYIMKEGDDGSYLYTKGDSDFADNWAIKGGLTYETFDEIF